MGVVPPNLKWPSDVFLRIFCFKAPDFQNWTLSVVLWLTFATHCFPQCSEHSLLQLSVVKLDTKLIALLANGSRLKSVLEPHFNSYLHLMLSALKQHARELLKYPVTVLVKLAVVEELIYYNLLSHQNHRLQRLKQSFTCQYLGVTSIVTFYLGSFPWDLRYRMVITQIQVV